MPLVRPCIVGRLGSTTFYETTLTGRQLASSVRPAKETDFWASASIEERMQRTFDVRRIRETIVPYLATHPDRFFGSLIVLAPEGAIKFESLAAVIDEPPLAPYRRAARHMGFVSIEPDELVALDGQHRLLAYREVVAGGPALGAYAGEAVDDEISVLMIEFETAQKTRRIFNKVNRHARATSRAENIITSEDDGCAIVTRWLLDPGKNGPLAARWVQGAWCELVDWRTDTLNRDSWHLTTVSAVHETVRQIARNCGYSDFDERSVPLAPADKDLDAVFAAATTWWTSILRMKVLQSALNDPSKVPHQRFDADHEAALLLRPTGQIAFIRGVIRAHEADESLTPAELISRADTISWKTSKDSVWEGSLVLPDGRINARSDAVALAAELMAYLLLGQQFESSRRDALERAWNRARGSVDERLPIPPAD